MIKMNKRMRDLLSESVIIEVKKLKNNLTQKLPILKVIETKGCVLIDDDSIDIKTFDIERIIEIYYDRTGFEASHNHIHIDSYIDNKKRNADEELILSLKLLDQWEEVLKSYFPQYRFHIVLSFNGAQAVLRFYRLREDESCWIDIDNLEGYKEEAILVKEICGSW